MTQKTKQSELFFLGRKALTQVQSESDFMPARFGFAVNSLKLFKFTTIVVSLLDMRCFFNYFFEGYVASNFVCGITVACFGLHNFAIHTSIKKVLSG